MKTDFVFWRTFAVFFSFLIAISPLHAAEWNAQTQGNFLYALAADARGQIWAGTEDSGLWRQIEGDWQKLALPELPGTDTISALAVDTKGRIWCGHLRGGVSVVAGDKTRNFDVLSGPLSERITDIAVSPLDGSVWLASGAGIARYDDKNQLWTYFTRAEGLMSDQISCLAFNARGDLFAGAACDGLIVARVADNYQKWTAIAGAAIMPDTPTGAGLPSNLINDVLVAPDGAIWVATNLGLAKSLDDGASWFFLRGKDWKENVEGTAIGLRPRGAETGVELLAEDWVNCLALGEKGQIWIGFRQKGWEMRNGKTNELLLSSREIGGLKGGDDDVRAILPLGGGNALIGRYGNGLAPIFAPKTAAQAAPIPEVQDGETVIEIEADAAELSAPALAPDKAQLEKWTQRAKALSETVPAGTGAFLGVDWRTQGDWVGRYGDQFARLYAVMSPLNHELTRDGRIQIGGSTGPHRVGDYAGGNFYIQWLESANPNVLYDPILGKRRMAEWNDGSWQHDLYPYSFEGPDLWLAVEIPEGTHRLALYFFNKDGHSGANRYRDYVVHLKAWKDDLEDAAQSPDLARGRIKDFWVGGYAQFLLQGPAKFRVRVERNRSHVTILSAALMDRIGGPPHVADTYPMPWMGKIRYVTEPVPNAKAPETPEVGAARELWKTLDQAADKTGGAQLLWPGRVMALRAAQNAGATEAVLHNWRWKMGVWTESDRSKFENTMAQAFVALQGELKK